jgi:uncharacterized membrane protein
MSNYIAYIVYGLYSYNKAVSSFIQREIRNMNNISKIVLAIVAIVIIVLGIFAYMSLSQPRAQGTKNIYYIYEESERSAKPSNITRRG